MPKRIAIILAGGEGTRLWPVSTDKDPKQLTQRLFGTPLVVQAYRRATSIIPPEDTYILTTSVLSEGVRSATGIAPSNLIVEPVRKDTGPAFALAASIFAGREDTVCAMLNADHVIEDIPAFAEALDRAYRLASLSDSLVTIGTVPASPAPGLGYILRGPAERVEKCRSVTAFIEKPDAASAATLISQGALWNTGMYVWRPQVLLSIMDKVAPELALHAREAGRAYTEGRTQAVREWYEHVPKGSFDRFVSEKAEAFSVVESSHDWLDVGTWQSYYEALPKDECGNACALPPDGSLIAHNSSRNVIAPTHRRVVLLGVDDLVIAANDEDILIAHRSQSHRIKEVLQEISAR